MNGSRAAGRYAKALLSYAGESNVVQKVFEDMKLICQVLSQNTDLDIVLRSPVIKSVVKKNILTEVFKEVSSLTLRLFDVLIANRRISILESVAQYYVRYYNEINGLKEVVVTTAFPMTEEIEQQVRKKVMEVGYAQDLTIKNIVDPSIIGGFVLRIDDLQYNASISHQIQQYRQYIKENRPVLANGVS